MTTLKQALSEFRVSVQASNDEGYDNYLVSICDDLQDRGNEILGFSRDLADEPKRYQSLLAALIRVQSKLNQDIKQLSELGPPSRIPKSKR